MKTKIGLIAMSGIRAQNKELVELGLTLPGFIERSKVIASLPSLSLLTLAGMTPDSFDVEYHEIQEYAERDALPDGFDLVAITSLSAQVFEAYKVAAHFRALGVPVVMGGLHVTAAPDEAMKHCDAIVIGEGENVWPSLLDDFSRGNLKRVYQARDHGEFDLAAAPMPRFDLLDPDKYNRITVQTSRGCPHKCEFCASSILLTPRYKLKPVDKVIAEIRAIKAIWPRPFIEFADDNSFVHKAHYKELMRELAKEDLRWFTESDLAVAEDPELLGLMRDAGCEQVLIGFESPRVSSLAGIELAADWKARRRDRYLGAIKRIQSHGITVNGCFILGLDGDTPEVFDEVFSLEELRAGPRSRRKLIYPGGDRPPEEGVSQTPPRGETEAESRRGRVISRGCCACGRWGRGCACGGGCSSGWLRRVRRRDVFDGALERETQRRA
jgi:radical SAM superfamily enzyme YgiQ (UPF0313 family)